MTDSQILREIGLSPDHLDKMASLFAAGAGYHQYTIEKRNGGVRDIYAPVAECSTVLKMLRIALEWAEVYLPPDCVHGYVAGRGTRSNATEHLNRDAVLNIDLEDFFPSIDLDRIEGALANIGVEAEFRNLIARSTTIRGHLPAGFSTSPLLSNIVFRDTDVELMQLAEFLEVRYTRYADDLTFSGTLDDGVLSNVTDLLERRGWALNTSKTRFMRRGGPQYVTGLYVGCEDHPRVPRRLKRLLRQRLHYMSQYGLVNVQERRRNETMSPDLAYGWATYIRQIEPEVGAKMLKTLSEVDFSDQLARWGRPEDWSDILGEIGM